MKGLIVSGKGQMSLVEDLSIPIAAKGEVIVKVIAASVNPYDLESAEGTYDAYFAEYGVNEPVQTGLEFSGILTSDGEKFKEGDSVYGYVHLITGCKTHAEYIAVPEAYLSHKPNALTHEQAASLPIAALTSIEVYENLAKQTGSKSTLIIGAGGSVGAIAVQIAKLAGFKVTAIGSSSQLEKLDEIGADISWDYSQVNLSEISENYDVIFDLSTRYTLGECLHLLSPTGLFVPALPDESKDPSTLSEREAYLMVLEGDGSTLNKCNEWVEAGKVTQFVDSVFKFEDYENAMERLKARGKFGKIILNWTSVS